MNTGMGFYRICRPLYPPLFISAFCAIELVTILPYPRVPRANTLHSVTRSSSFDTVAHLYHHVTELNITKRHTLLFLLTPPETEEWCSAYSTGTFILQG